LFDPVLLKTVLKALVLPPAGPLLVALAGVLCWRRRPRLGRALAAGGVLSLLALSLPIVAMLLLRAVEVAPPLDWREARSAQAIVILGGGVRRAAPEYGGDTLSRLTLERVRYGAVVAKTTQLPVLVAGGAVFGGTPEALLMREALKNEFGVDVRWVEVASRTTRENAQRTAAILRAEGVSRIVLVAHGFDMRRAIPEFERTGLAVVPAPTLVTTDRLEGIADFLPSMSALSGSYYALYELLANAVRLLDP
jgi:uncharacterized SAM-binding protein YcdF (DUF218 family)